jgi:alanine racemase
VTGAQTIEDRLGRPTRALIDLEAFERNFLLACRLGGEERQVMAVVKADAYGHGAVELAGEAQRLGASSLGVATIGEARQLREAGLTLPVVIMSEITPAAAAEAVRLECVPVVYTLALAETLEKEAGKAGRQLPVHLKIDTGMGRVGALPADAPALAAKIEGLPHLLLEGVMTHLSDADRPEKDKTERQLGEFFRVADLLEGKFPSIRYRHVSNSALLMRGEAAGNLTRPGIMLYGSPPVPGFPGAEGLKPVMKLVTAVAYLKRVPSGYPLSYGETFVTERESLVATLPVGYADGYVRALSNRAEVLVRGRRVPQVGTICMDLCLVDVTDVPGVKEGDEVVLIGSQGNEMISAEEVAGLLGTISYEVYCNVSRRVPRIHYRGEEGIVKAVDS